MSIRRDLKITLEEEDILVERVCEYFQDLMETGGKEKLREKVGHMLSYNDIRNDDELNIHYTWTISLGSLRVILAQMRKKKKLGKKKIKK